MEYKTTHEVTNTLQQADCTKIHPRLVLSHSLFDAFTGVIEMIGQ